MQINIKNYKKTWIVELINKDKLVKTLKNVNIELIFNDDIFNNWHENNVNIYFNCSSILIYNNEYPNINNIKISKLHSNQIKNLYHDKYVSINDYQLRITKNHYRQTILVEKKILNLLDKKINKYEIKCFLTKKLIEIIKKYESILYFKKDELILCLNKKVKLYFNIINYNLDRIVDLISKSIYTELYRGNLIIFKDSENEEFSSRLLNKLKDVIEKKVIIIEAKS